MTILRSVSTLAACLSRKQIQRTTKKKQLCAIEYPYPKTNHAHSPKTSGVKTSGKKNLENYEQHICCQLKPHRNEYQTLLCVWGRLRGACPGVLHNHCCSGNFWKLNGLLRDNGGQKSTKQSYDALAFVVSAFGFAYDDHWGTF